MLIISHRGNVDGPNTPDLHNQFALELDVRYASDVKRLIISHDPAPYSPSIDAKKVLSTDKFVALNIKQDGLFDDLIPITFNGFLFDFELWCLNPDREIEMYSEHFKIARRLSDRGETPHGKYDYIWLDEMDTTNSVNIEKFDINKMIYVSPELHGRPIDERRRENFFAVCTDYPNVYFSDGAIS